MLEIFKALHYTLEDSTSAKGVKLITINNPDGTLRWMIPANAPRPYFLKLYNVSGIKSIAFSAACRIIFFLRLQQLFFKTEKIFLARNPLATLDLFSNRWAVFTGTPGPNRKAVLYEDGVVYKVYTKIAIGERSMQLLSKEATALKRVWNLNCRNINLPHVLNKTSTLLQQSDISRSGKRTKTFTYIHLRALQELFKKTRYTIELHDYDNWKYAEENLDCLNDERLTRGLIQKLKMLRSALRLEHIQVGLNHGDFTPWNTYLYKNTLGIYDWEMAEELPAGYDAFHFIIQKGILIDRKPWIKIKTELIDYSYKWKRWMDVQRINWMDYLKLYMILNITRQLKIFSEQRHWHQQINWLLEAWDDATSDLLRTEYCNRQLLIIDTFDYLRNKKYATIKFPNIYPEKLSINSDIDMCIDKQDANALLSFLEKHPLVINISKVHKSYMSTLNVFLNDGKLLSFDLIWEFKRKHLVFLNRREVLSRAFTNSYGVKCLSLMDEARYIGLFYGLNHCEVPIKYHEHVETLSVSTQMLDVKIFQSLMSQRSEANSLKALLLKDKSNRFMNRLFNRMVYIVDTLKEMLLSKGIVLTFSGVDGAGKSTVIEETKTLIEKRLRKRTVVLRHRPSVLPILSAWIKGKAKAEEDATNTLPRQGKNTSLISSLFRFGYYFTDYLFGQFYIYIKYVSRGYVVLYDRYYFDFINDSRRSNITIPQFLSRFCYKLLLKPDLNFFLYADPNIILSRKRELDSETIVQLTQQYKTLFDELSKDPQSSYYALENIQLKHTTDFIIEKTILKSA